MSPKLAINTLSRRRRRVYFQALTVIFVLAAPLLFLYATGYRFETLTLLTETGGIYVGAEQSGTEIYLNGELVHETGTFRRAFYIQDLKPGTYTVTVSKEGYSSWRKTLKVYAQIVTEAQAFNMPQEPVLELIPSTFTNQTANATTTKIVPNPVYEEIKTAFARATATSTAARTLERRKLATRAEGTSSASSTAGTVGTGTTKTFRGMQISADGEAIVARWMRTAESAPFYFCVRESECADSIVLNTKEEKPVFFDFFPGTTDLVIVTLADGVYVTELDNRSEQNIEPLYLAPGADFRLIDGGIYIKTADNTIYKVEI